MNLPVSFQRRKSRRIIVGDVAVGACEAISVQTMTKTKTADVKATVDQIKRCKDSGADIVRVTINDKKAAEAIGDIIKKVNIPLVADIHFNHVFAIMAIEAGISKVRINPGNIGSKDRIKLVLDKAKEHGIPIRIGVNSGSLEKDILDKHGYPTAEALFESAMRHIEIAQDFGFDDLAISVKSTSVPLMIEAYRLIAAKTDFPLHLGVTEAGTYKLGTIKSSIGIGTLLSEGIGDTIRVSLTDEPEAEVEVGKDILRSLRLAQRGLEIISCPTCGRLEVDLINITKNLEEKLKGIDKNVSIAILGCVVNGPGEAKEADIGIAAGNGVAILYKKGETVRKIKEEQIIDEVYKEVINFKSI
ncbi:flavodoxin-dependent (E)-4-hydroxy-3-methylbut-2-enyl-diphosphate synthase [Bacteroidota bacterium]